MTARRSQSGRNSRERPAASDAAEAELVAQARADQQHTLGMSTRKEAPFCLPGLTTKKVSVGCSLSLHGASAAQRARGKPGWLLTRGPPRRRSLR